MALLLAIIRWPRIKHSGSYRFSFSLFGIFLMIYLPKLIFTLIFLTGILLSTISSLLGINNSLKSYALLIALALFVLLILALADAMLFGRFRFKTRKYSIRFDRLPPAFKGFKIAQISDMHLGSFFGNKKAVQKGLKKLIDARADLIVFTGDLVNNYASEAKPYISVLANLSAPYGKYAILGNHDYADYSHWKSPQAKAANMKLLYDIHNKSGFHLLLNESIWIEKEGQKMALTGVENWGKPPFHQYGNLDLARKEIDPEIFNILLSHDPSHWKARILPNTKADLTLSGHTHGMQLGIDLPFFKWSPVKWRYPEWAGLYRQGQQWLNVNRGFGYIGFPGRMGIRPEISVIELN